MTENNENKEIVAQDKETGVEQTAEPQISSQVKKNSISKKIANFFLSDDSKQVYDGIFKSIIEPAMKKLLVEAFRALVYHGKISNDGYDPNDNYTDYGSFSGSSHGGSERQLKRDFGEITFDTKRDAEIVLGTMKNYLKKKGLILVADYYKIAHQRPERTYYNWGWQNLNATYIFSYTTGGKTMYGIHLPEPIYVEHQN